MLLKEMMSRILLVVILFSWCSCQEIDLCRQTLNRLVDTAAMRWPFSKGNQTIDDSTITEGVFEAVYSGSLIDYPPGVGHCGGKYPIWQKERKLGSSVVCVQNESDTCFKEFEIKTAICGSRYRYELRTDVKGSAFCFQPRFCQATSYLCKNGGTCIDERDGYSCQCRHGFSGPTCEGDPCSISKPLPRMDERLPSNHVVGSDSDANLSGWYSVDKGMKLLNRLPSVPSCGSNYPLWSLGRWGNVEIMCEESAEFPCSYPHVLLTKTCANTRVFATGSSWSQVNFCFECRPGPLDVLVIEDVSSSVMNSDYTKMKDYIIEIVRDLHIGKEANNVAFLSFAKTAKVGFHLNDHVSNVQVLTAIASYHGEGGGTVVSSALELSASDVFTYHNGDRADADNIVLLFTDGIFKDESSLEQDLEVLKARAEIYVVTVGPVVSNTTVTEMATSLDHILKLGDPSTVNVINAALHPDPTCGAEEQTEHYGR